tara:strand:+ start:189 stop:452 length:264 start_codon:yes stop_codon:yes gene_type:complete
MHKKELKKHKKTLEVTINKVLKDAPQINDVIHKIQEEGYDVFLMVEATIGFNKCEDENLKESLLTKVELDLSSQDKNFLHQLKINPK